MANNLTITTRELVEIRHAMWYEKFASHGTVGHNMLILIAKMAKAQGFEISSTSDLIVPGEVIVDDSK